MRSDKFRPALVEAIESAQLEQLPEHVRAGRKPKPGGADDSFMNVVRDVVEGNATPEEVEDRLVEWANRVVDVPLIPERVERWGLEQISDILVNAALDAAKEYLDIDPS